MNSAERIAALSPAKRALLDALLHTSRTGSMRYSQPITPAEITLARIWADVLGVDSPGIHDNFLRLGGDSLRALQVSARARKHGLHLTADLCVQFPTIAQLALQASQPADDDELWFRSSNCSAEDLRFAVSFGEEQLWVQHQLHPDETVLNSSVALDIRGAFEPALFERAIAAVTDRHELLRTSFVMRRGRLAREVRPPFPFELRRLRCGDGEAAVRAIIDAETEAPFDVERGPLFRCLSIEVDERHHVLVMTAHHLVVDGPSLRLITTDLAQSYRQSAAGLDAACSPPPVRYAAFAAWQRALVSSGKLDSQAAWWREILASYPAGHGIRTDRPRQARRTLRGDILHYCIGDMSPQLLREVAATLGCTLYVLLLSVWHLTLYRRGAGADVVIGTPVTWRPGEDLQGVVGYFLNTVPLRLTCKPDWTLETLVERNNARAAGSLSRAGIPYGLMYGGAGGASQSGAPAMQLWFVLEEAVWQALDFGDLTVIALDLPRSFAPFELALSIQAETDGLCGWLEFATELYDRATAEDLLQRFMATVRTLPDCLDQPCGAVQAVPTAPRYPS